MTTLKRAVVVTVGDGEGDTLTFAIESSTRCLGDVEQERLLLAAAELVLAGLKGLPVLRLSPARAKVTWKARR